MRIGIDAGGTFTDFVILQDDGRLESFKLRSDPASPARVILEGIRRATTSATVEVIHGSTVATNALLERKGARTAFITTGGFEDLLYIGRQNRARLYDLTPSLRSPLVPRLLCFGVFERVWYDGTVSKRPGKGELKILRDKLRRRGMESAAICFLHAYQNAENERAVAQALEKHGYVCCSHEISPEFREYERASTTVINAYVGPLMDAYLAELERARRCRIFILQSNGGFMTAAEARRHAVRTVLSGPAGGVVGARAAACASGFENVISFDMGGTSTDLSLFSGDMRITTEGSIDGFPVRVPMLDIHTVGAGGGSIARVDEGGLLRVGPESAGAVPGPACYGAGDQPTVTDAHVVLGRISANQFLQGELRLDPSRAEKAIALIARRLELNLVSAAAGILRVANANMERAIRVVSTERGHDPRGFVLVAFGGCGGLHACEIAQDLKIGTVLVPQHAGVLSALGMLLADRVRDYSAGALAVTGIEKRFASLERKAKKEVPGAQLARSVDMRYAGQSYELNVPWNAARPAIRFHEEHERAYGFSDQNRETEIVTIRVRATLPVKGPALIAASGQDSSAEKPKLRRVWIAGKWRRVPVYQREQVMTDERSGPALVLDYGATTLVPPGWSFTRDQAGTLIARLR